ncbi:4-hydroxybenzoate polyprenyltransferase, mitochondrial-like isoform X1 [Mya arenaria]|uniref:4-hydroxybenzoate polyprenyltransferase, mitochondrial-like isoform X1 n=1 Tax=Mya arenaria TaxID=6604 RepID=UPI0022E4CBAC|nr:4-hydroxybenzoate polyprenyltransferase, mitochondrial-like isoform X1 [Mya arenaria]
MMFMCRHYQNLTNKFCNGSNIFSSSQVQSAVATFLRNRFRPLTLCRSLFCIQHEHLTFQRQQYVHQQCKFKHVLQSDIKNFKPICISSASYNTLSAAFNQHMCGKNKRDCLFNTYPAVLCHPSHHSRHLNTQKIIEAAPKSFQPYLRLIRFDKPIGTFLLFWPCTWSIALAAPAGALPSLYLLTLFGLGSFIMRGAGCIINDMWDKDIDAKVERTRTRPLASGELSHFQALCFLGANLTLALTILLQLNWYSVFLGASSMGLVVGYPLAKRFTYWPQIMLGLTLNWGVLLAWAGIHGSVAGPALSLYTACVLYTMFYDTIYSHQDKYFDMLIGVKSTALKFGDNTKPWLAGFGSGMISLLALTGHLCDQTWPYYTGVAITAAHLAHQLYTVDLDNPDDCMAKFKSNTQLGAVLFLAIVIGTLLKPTDKEDTKDTAKVKN